MAQTYLGNTEINSLYLGQTKINNIQRGKLFTEGLIALYNPKAVGGYSGNTIYDLSGNGNDLTLTGNYSVGTGSNAGSIFFASGSGASTAGNLSTALHGTTSEFTIAAFYKWKWISPEFWLPTWYIGSTSNTSSVGQQIFEATLDYNTVDLGFGISNQNFSSSYANTAQSLDKWALYEMTGSVVTAPPFPYWTPVAPWNSSTSDLWSFTGITKANQTLSYTIPDANYTMYADGYSVANINLGGQVTGSLLNSKDYGFVFPSGYQSPGGFTNEIADDGTNILTTNLESSKLYINPIGNALADPFLRPGTSSYHEFWFGGFAVYDRVLSPEEMLILDTYFQTEY